MRSTYGWTEISKERKRDIIAAIRDGRATAGPSHLELDLTDRCNVDCYFCSQMDVRTKQEIPLPRIISIIDELKQKGLRTIRLAGGGDPLFHRSISQVIEFLGTNDIIVDNITTNGLGLTRPIAEQLVQFGCRELLISLNAPDRDDYARMMQVKPALFDRIVENITYLRSIRKEGHGPGIVLQFLLDRGNYMKLPAMYELARQIGADVMALNVVLEIPLNRIDRSVLLTPDDAELLRDGLRQILASDKEHGLVQICFPFDSWNAMVRELQDELGTKVSAGFETASTYTEENGQCFFGWYTAVVRGNGDLYPCCLLLNPEYKPLGNAMEGQFADQWNGPTFNRLRHEMREVFITKGQVRYSEHFKTLRPECVTPYGCWLKSIYFRADEAFYRELGDALREVRSHELSLLRGPRSWFRHAEMLAYRSPRFARAYDAFRFRTRGVRQWLRDRVGLNLTAADRLPKKDAVPQEIATPRP